MDNVKHKAEPSGATLVELVHSVMHRLRSEQYQALREGPHAVTHMETKVLGYFGHHAGATLSDLAQHSGRDRAQLARLIKGLRDRGLLDGETDPADRRNLRLKLTDSGTAVQQALAQQSRRLATRAVAGLSAADKARLQDLLQRMQGNLAADT